MKELQVTVDFGKMRARKPSASAVDIVLLVKAVPSARVLAGDRFTSVQVQIDERQEAMLWAAVGDFCVVEDYSDLELY
jgi:hypothetical protein